MTGENARYQSYIRTAYLKGHAIGAHSYTHKYSIYQSEETYFEDLGNIEKIIKEQTGRTSKFDPFPWRKFKYGIKTLFTGNYG